MVETTATRTTSFTITPRGPFSFEAACGFLAGFPPARHTWVPAGGRLLLAFPLDGYQTSGAVALYEMAGTVHGEVSGTGDAAAVRRQVARIFSLDHDGSGYTTVGERDPVIGRLQAAYPGLRPVCFTSPYESAAWAILSQRIQMAQAAQLKARLVAELGQHHRIDGQPVSAFPLPATLLQLESFPGIPAEKIVRLRGIAQAALDGRLDAERLRALPHDEALDELRTLRGIGDWSAKHILLRGAGPVDELPQGDPRTLGSVARAYNLSTPPGHAHFEQIAEAWRPYRMWVCVLLRVAAPAL